MIEYFVAGATARTAAAPVGVNKSTTAYYFRRLRTIISQGLVEEMALDGAIEVDESYFCGRGKGKRGRGEARKVPVFDILKRGGRVYTQVIPIRKPKRYSASCKSGLCPTVWSIQTSIDLIMY